MRNFKELQVWEKSHAFVKEVYLYTRSFPAVEQFGITSQLRRSAASIPANIAEGCGRNGNKELSRYMNIAAGSACETEYHLLLAHELKYLDKKTYADLDQTINEIKKMLSGYIKKLKQSE